MPTAPLFDQPPPGSNLPEFTVTEISRLVKKTMEESFGLVRVRGEISGLKVAPSGHIYFDLKDQDATLASICWRGQASKLGLKLENGMEVICTGKLTTYPARSNYQLIIEQAVLAGMGALLKLLEERKKKLAAEGLFDVARKQPLPFLPDVIGIVTSPTGAVIRDILHRFAERFPRHVLVWPVLVQGPDAAAQVAAAIEGFNALPLKGEIPRPDIIIVARGGGSVEDLMPFNEEIVVRAAAASKIPLISAVGHETDTTLIDYAADVRAPTPSAAAEMAVPVREDLLATVMSNGRRLWDNARRLIDERREKLALLSRALGEPARAIEPLSQRLDEKDERLSRAIGTYIERREGRLAEAAGKLRHPRDVVALAVQRLEHLDHRMQGGMREYLAPRQNRLERLAAGLAHLSPKAVLSRGYALVHDETGRVVMRQDEAKRGAHVRIEFQDGARKAVMED